MTMKNGKTILFASLIAAMILPFSGMQFATAEEQTTQDKIRELIQIHKTQLNPQNNDGDTDIVIERLELSVRLLDIRDALENHPKSEKLQEREKRILEKLIKLFDKTTMNSFDTLDIIPMPNAYYPSTTYKTSEQTRYDCADRKYETGNIEGVITAVTRESSYISVIENYPRNTSLGNSSTGYCSHSDLESIDIGYRIINGKFTGCFDKFNADEFPKIMSCNNIGTDFSPHVILVTNSAHYERNIEFSPNESWTIVYLG